MVYYESNCIVEQAHRELIEPPHYQGFRSKLKHTDGRVSIK